MLSRLHYNIALLVNSMLHGHKSVNMLLPQLNLLKQVRLQILIATSRCVLLHENLFMSCKCILKMLLLPVLDLPNSE